MSRVIRFIGDVHGVFPEYMGLIEGVSQSIQVGDFGIGFGNDEGTVTAAMAQGNHRFVRGNHDDPAACKRHPAWIADGTMHEGIFCVGGAFSIDRADRTQGVDWWPDEELTIQSFYTVLDLYEHLKPDVVVTHDCPERIASVLFEGRRPIKTRTAQALERMLDIHRPKFWVFGHWHHRRHAIVEGVEFLCLATLDHADVQL